ncbi:hypothetical protein A6R71_05555 [Xanthomonas translucens pv. arrhenatheri]|uniref:DUF924 domain-containing protein n=1 Tax=Xanthomonas graminis pv. arrhenatheri LMG 727 TaxID=1195923 RepID=A0A0K3A3P2_9XANT|nr:DUF924 family protein [Xanthomonas translucens]OAX66131.1 hypothetical protein A6R71_05555 [Xanthomonas translucens pv. arrhenatheri]UKE78401.1 DUF924 family protein [Xanthomonas translucens pv. arrhenatheri]CTP92751.1 hypothetical protein XTALMG727_3876 [Xanthomonas translucens pv. arrhenatheri LMG 727]
MTETLPCDVVEFWRSAGRERWFAANESFDANVRQHFLDAHHAAARDEYAAWMCSAEGALALLLLLDQVPRNAFRGSAHAYATDGLARRYAQWALAAGFDQQVEPALRMFFYLPYEHAEDAALQREAVELFSALGDADSLQWATQHEDIIQRFGRFPHRNAALGWDSTQDEQRFLDEGGFAG